MLPKNKAQQHYRQPRKNFSESPHQASHNLPRNGQPPATGHITKIKTCTSTQVPNDFDGPRQFRWRDFTETRQATNRSGSVHHVPYTHVSKSGYPLPRMNVPPTLLTGRQLALRYKTSKRRSYAFSGTVRKNERMSIRCGT